MRKNKIYDCITFFQENFITNIRFEILNKHVDFFIVCESIYDHRGKKKEINFKLNNPDFRDKVRHIVLRDPFPEKLNSWEKQAFQREYIFNGIKDSHDEDYIMFSDPDEIPRPEELKNFILKKKYAIFQQKCFNYKFNLLNINETPWSGTRLTKRKFLKSFDYMRQKILKKNIKKWWKFNVERNIQIIDDGGWHFNNLFSPEMISIKLKTFAHNEFASEEYSNIEVIKEKIDQKKDLFNKDHKLERVDIDETYPDYIIQKMTELKKFIL
ncbi:glycosyl transferase family 17 [Candidatus Pelagibacter sp.]|nr:glycosyl transferase family 17 [Candidatus Pelagibacter sp.]